MKGVVVTLLFVALWYNGHTQNKFGVTGGLNLSGVSADDGNDYVEAPLKSILGFHAGVYFGSRLSQMFHVYTELQYSQRGVRDGFFAEKTILGYLELPILMSLQPNNWVGFEIGPNLSYLLASDLENRFGMYSKITFKKVDFGPTAGIRITFNEKLAIILRYYYGLTLIADANLRDNMNADMGQIEHYNRMVQFGIRVPL
jgi:hypothetical protein